MASWLRKERDFFRKEGFKTRMENATRKCQLAIGRGSEHVHYVTIINLLVLVLVLLLLW